MNVFLSVFNIMGRPDWASFPPGIVIDIRPVGHPSHNPTHLRWKLAVLAAHQHRANIHHGGYP
ncbi:hypothetical protein Hanom_Chr07g00613401 [Helianthus anomalus]